MKFPRITHPLVAATLMAVSFSAFAQPAATGTGKETAPEWTKADSNRDGFLSKDELVPYPTLGQDFDEIDSDGDGKISESEYASWFDADHHEHDH